MIMIIEALRWWYGAGWMQSLHRISTWTTTISKTFSVGLLLRTLFSPWRRIVSFGGRSIDEKIRAMLDNLVSRCIGFFVRITVIVSAGVAMLGAFLGGVVLFLAWPLLPIAVLYFGLRGIIG
jgi:hypothetical protein